jgi:hypothetical protein
MPRLSGSSSAAASACSPQHRLSEPRPMFNKIWFMIVGGLEYLIYLHLKAPRFDLHRQRLLAAAPPQ